MKSKYFSIHDQQAWLQQFIIDDAPFAQKLAANRHFFGSIIEDLIKESRPEISREQRLWVYTSGYFTRLIECLKADYPLLLQFLGEETFTVFIKAYLVQKKSSSFSLYDLGKELPLYLQNSIPVNTKDERYLFYLLPIEIARYERVFLETYRMPSTTAPPIFNDLMTLEIAMGIIQQPEISAYSAIPCQQGLWSIINALHQQQEISTTLEQGEEYIAFYRKDWLVKTSLISEQQYKEMIATTS